ncbi:MAG: SPOR domain-containing protein [Myxococcales bacterium]|nr:SPOR domain-containing protein [Myxococcales bacterium]
MARRRAREGGGGGVGTLVSLALLIVIGFSIGIVAGILWEEPRLVLAHLTGRTTEIAWTRDVPSVAAPPRTEAPVPATPRAADRGQSPPVAAAPPVSAPPLAAPPLGSVAVQVGAFADSVGAERLASQLRSAGYPVYVTPGASQDTPRWRVRVGPLADRDAAERLAARLKREEQLPTWVLDEHGG